jgi:hypothetical protein
MAHQADNIFSLASSRKSWLIPVVRGDVIRFCRAASLGKWPEVGQREKLLRRPTVACFSTKTGLQILAPALPVCLSLCQILDSP